MGIESRRHDNDGANHKKQKLAFGLNDRRDPAPQQHQRRRPIDDSNGPAHAAIKNVFLGGGSSGDDDSDHENDGDDDSGGRAASRSSRARVNRELRREQEALRRRAAERQDQQPGGLQQNNKLPSAAGSSGAAESTAAATTTAAAGADSTAAAGADSALLYDYDGPYETFKAPPQPAASSATPRPDARKSSRYVGALLRAAEERQRERELRLERKVAKEQAEEAEGDESLGGKARFVTSAYKRKLQERELWQREQQAKEALEVQADVTLKSNASLAMSSFYSNLNRNAAMGGGNGGEATEADADGHRRSERRSDDEARLGRTGLGGDAAPPHQSRDWLDGFERPGDPAGSGGGGGRNDDDDDDDDDGADPDSSARALQQRRQARERKVEQARGRYFERHPDRGRPDAAAAQ